MVGYACSVPRRIPDPAAARKAAAPDLRVIQFSAYGIRPPRRHGGTENDHGDEVVPRASLGDLQVWGNAEADRTWRESNTDVRDA